MNSFERGIIDLIKSAITGESIKLPEDFDWEKAYDLCIKHQIIPIFYYGMHNSKIAPPSSIAAKIEIAAYKYISVSTNQIYELERICKLFEENKIEYLPLKGSVLKYLYPKPELRSMGDADILIKVEQYDVIKPIMVSLGFSETVESDHELIWNKPAALNLELHKRLIPSYNKDYYTYFGDGWRLAHKTETTRYEMTDEDNFIYLFTHYAKHYRDAGIGVRHLTDFYVFLKAKPNLNKNYIEKELKKLQLLEFYRSSMKTLEVWFGNDEDTELTDYMTARILKSGSYGTYRAHIISKAVKESKSFNSNSKVKNNNLIKLIFMPYNDMCEKYHFLGKIPVLLPIMWVVRWITAIFFKRDNIRKQNKKLKLMAGENISEYQQELNYVGLDFNFKE